MKHLMFERLICKHFAASGLIMKDGRHHDDPRGHISGEWQLCQKNHPFLPTFFEKVIYARSGAFRMKA